MFVKENVIEQDKELYAKIAYSRWNEKYSDWIIDRDREIYIVCSGKRGVETPVIFYMLFRQMKIEFWIWEIEYQPSSIFVKIPLELIENKSEIENAIREAYYDTDGLIDTWSLPSSIDNNIFEFKIN